MTSLSTTALHRLLSFESFFALRPSRGTVLRIATDIGFFWLAFLFGWIFIEHRSLAALAAPESKYVLPLIGLFSLLVFVSYADAGLYTCPHSYALTSKIRRIVSINLALLAIGIGRIVPGHGAKQSAAA